MQLRILLFNTQYILVVCFLKTLSAPNLNDTEMTSLFMLTTQSTELRKAIEKQDLKSKSRLFLFSFESNAVLK